VEWKYGDPETWAGGQAGVSIGEIRRLSPVRHGYTHFRVVAHPFLYRLREAPSEIAEREEGLWLHPHEFDRYALSALDRRILKNLLTEEDSFATLPERNREK